MNPPPRQLFQDVRAAVERECHAIEDVITVLLREQSQLVSGSSDGLDAVVTQKNAGLDQLERLRHDRLHTLKKAGAPTDPHLMDQFVAKDAALTRLWQRLRALARDCHRINALNGRLVNVRLQFVDGRLDTLRRLSGKSAVYDPAGRSGYTPSSRIDASA
jgi:flagellar biosynthesis/type III secretory pathway chaperone